jgi:hypothetical protein
MFFCFVDLLFRIFFIVKINFIDEEFEAALGAQEFERVAAFVDGRAEDHFLIPFYIGQVLQWLIPTLLVQGCTSIRPESCNKSPGIS